jgi:short-subunit dehydrogenase
MKKRIVVIGASRGIGAELVKHFAHLGHDVIGVSRTQALHCDWIKTDIATEEGIQYLCKKLNNQRVDTLLFSSGVWEEYGFTNEFDFRKTTLAETNHIMSINLVAPIEITKRLAYNLNLSDNPRAIYLGALSGLDNLPSEQVAYAASKFGLRGAIQALRKALKKENIGFTVINLGNVGTEEVLQDIEEKRTKAQTLIPLTDIISTAEWILSVSPSVEIAEVDLIQR